MSTISIGLKCGSDYLIDGNCNFDWWLNNLEIKEDSKEAILFQIGWDRAHGVDHLSFASFLKANDFKVIHHVDDEEGIFEVYSNGDYTIKYYNDEDGTNIYPFFNNGNYVLQLNKLTLNCDFSLWNEFLNKDK